MNSRIIQDPTFGVPARSLIGNMGPGVGPAQAVSMEDVAIGVAATGIVASPGAPANFPTIADKRFLGNGSGATAAPVALSITMPAAGLTVAWAVGGITYALANDLAALEGLGSTGIAARTTTDTWAQRTITGTASRLTVTNGDGVSGNPTLDINASYAGQASITTLGTIATGTWNATKIGLAYGGTNADLSATGGASQFLKQASVGAAVTVVQPTYADIGSGSTAATATGLTISGGTLAGVTTLPGSGQISAAGELGLLAAPTSLLYLGGTYTTSNQRLINVDTTFASSNTGNQSGLRMSATFNPSGASCSGVITAQFQVLLDSTALNIATVSASNSLGSLLAGYSGTVTNFYMYTASNLVISGGAVTNFAQYRAGAITANDGATAGTKTNRQFSAEGITSGAAGATVNNRGVDVTVPSGTAPASGTVNNRGIYITGNGGAAPGGTGVVNNYAVLSDSTAPVSLAGTLDATELQQTAANGQMAVHKSLTELTTIAAAAFTDTAIQIPAEALVFAVSVRSNVAIPTAVTYDVGVAGATTRYATAISDAVGTTAKGTLDALRYYAAATSIRLTPNTTPGAATGKVRVTIHYIEITPPSS